MLEGGCDRGYSEAHRAEARRDREATEADRSSRGIRGRGPRGPRTPAGASRRTRAAKKGKNGRRGRRPGGGANQKKVLGILSATPKRAKDIAAADEEKRNPRVDVVGPAASVSVALGGNRLLPARGGPTSPIW